MKERASEAIAQSAHFGTAQMHQTRRRSVSAPFHPPRTANGLSDFTRRTN
jgi:hypothetical protein